MATSVVFADEHILSYFHFFFLLDINVPARIAHAKLDWLCESGGMIRCQSDSLGSMLS